MTMRRSVLTTPTERVEVVEQDSVPLSGPNVIVPSDGEIIDLEKEDARTQRFFELWARPHLEKPLAGSPEARGKDEMK